MKTGTTRHRKVYALAETLGIRRAEAVGILTGFWELAGEQFPDGDFSKAPLSYLAEYCMWHQDKGQELLDALIKAELVDVLDDGRRYIHDWHDHCENTVHRKLWRRKARFANGLPPKLAALDRQDKIDAGVWYSENTPENSNGIPAESRRGPLPLPIPIPLPKPLPKPEPVSSDVDSDSSCAPLGVSSEEAEEADPAHSHYTPPVLFATQLQQILGRNGQAKQFKADRTTYERLAEELNEGQYDHLAKTRDNSRLRLYEVAQGAHDDPKIKNPAAWFTKWCRENKKGLKP